MGFENVNTLRVEREERAHVALANPAPAPRSAPAPTRMAGPSPRRIKADTPAETAPLSAFTLVRGQVLCGTRLAEVRALADSIERFGLLAPLTVVRTNGRLVVVDGRKRLAALRRLAFQNRLPASLAHVPFDIAGKVDARARTSLLSNAPLYAAVLRRFRRGEALDVIARGFHISRAAVRDVLSLARLDEAVRRSLFEHLIAPAQALAFAGIPDPAVQRRVLMQLGPFARPDDIMDAGVRVAA